MSARNYGIYINNGKINKRILIEELDEYLNNGWSRGMKKRDLETNKKANKKRKETCLNKYGVENVHQNDKIKNKAKQTCILNYGVDNPAKNDIIKEKIKKTNQIKWPNNLNYHNIIKRDQTMIQKYGSIENFYNDRNSKIDWNKMMNRQIETKRKRGTFNYSQPEEDLYKELCEQYGKDNVLRNYKEKRYPFFCDFYIPSEDLFIELNRHWTHGGHPFNKNNKNDIKKLEEWKEKSEKSAYIKYAIYNWTEKDPLKMKIAKENNLNYKIIW